MNLLYVLIISILSGVAYSFDGVAYRFGAQVNLNSRQVLLPVVTLSALFYLFPALHQSAPWWFIAIAVGAGLSQYVMTWVMEFALRWGPLSPMWCALMLCFIPVIIFSAIVLHEPISLCQYVSMLLATGAVLEAARCQNGDASEPKKKLNWRYLVVLLLLVLLNAASNVALKVASSFTEIYDHADKLYLCCFFAATIVPVVIEFTVVKGWPKPTWKLGVSTLFGAGACSLGMLLLSMVVMAQAAIVYTAMNAASICSAGVISTVFFHEKRSKAWSYMMLFSVLAIGFSNVTDELLKFCFMKLGITIFQ